MCQVQCDAARQKAQAMIYTRTRPHKRLWHWLRRRHDWRETKTGRNCNMVHATLGFGWETAWVCDCGASEWRMNPAHEQPAGKHLRPA